MTTARTAAADAVPWFGIFFTFFCSSPFDLDWTLTTQSSPAAADNDYDSDKKEIYFWEGCLFLLFLFGDFYSTSTTKSRAADADDDCESSRRRRSSLVCKFFFNLFSFQSIRLGLDVDNAVQSSRCRRRLRQ